MRQAAHGRICRLLRRAQVNEVSALKALLSEVLCKGRILTADAAQSYHEYGRLVQRTGGDVIVIVKDNTPATRADLELFFEDPQGHFVAVCFKRIWKSKDEKQRAKKRQKDLAQDRPGTDGGREGNVVQKSGSNTSCAEATSHWRRSQQLPLFLVKMLLRDSQGR